MLKSLKIRGINYELPMYLPDATSGVVRGVGSCDLRGVGVNGVVANTYHLMNSPGVFVLEEFGGIKKFMGFSGLVVSDSGGWQIFSLIHRNNMNGFITSEGVRFLSGKGDGELFGPERSIQVQFGIGSDVMVCLDDFSPPGGSKSSVEQSVERTIVWAKRSKIEYERLVDRAGLDDSTRPLLVAVVQGDKFLDLRKYCADELIQIGFDGYGFGGYPMDEGGNFDFDLARKLASMLPDNKLKFALGVGSMQQVAKCASFGWNMFDCTLPTRDGRHKRLYAWDKEPVVGADLTNSKMYKYLYIQRARHKKDQGPISEWCDCLVCKEFSRAYLRHLFAIGDTLAYRLASIHNVRMYTRLMELLR